MRLERLALITLVYASTLLLVAGSSFVCLVYGIRFVPEQSDAWLLTSLIAVVLDLLVQEPVVIFVNAAVLVCLQACRRDSVFCHNLSPNFLPASAPWLGV
jgi:hypothetical protein